jgi:predicted transcriptional regulator
MTIELDFKQALRLDMERKGLSEAALGKALGITQQAVHKWLERGFPPLARLDDLLDVLGEGSEVSKLDHKSIYSGRSRTPPVFCVVNRKNNGCLEGSDITCECDSRLDGQVQVTDRAAIRQF